MKQITFREFCLFMYRTVITKLQFNAWTDDNFNVLVTEYKKFTEGSRIK